jgi:hypothetical protein
MPSVTRRAVPWIETGVPRRQDSPAIGNCPLLTGPDLARATAVGDVMQPIPEDAANRNGMF